MLSMTSILMTQPCWV